MEQQRIKADATKSKLTQTAAELAHQELNLAAREEALQRSERDNQILLGNLKERAADLQERKVAAESRKRDMERERQQLTLRNDELVSRDNMSERWSDLFLAAMLGKVLIEFGDDGKPVRLVNTDKTSIIPSSMQAYLLTRPPRWAEAALQGYAAFDRAADKLGHQEQKMFEYEKQLMALIQRAGPVLTPEQVSEVGRIKEVVSKRPTPDQIAVRMQGGGISRGR